MKNLHTNIEKHSLLWHILSSFIPSEVSFPKLFTTFELCSQIQIFSNLLLFSNYFSPIHQTDSISKSLNSILGFLAFSPGSYSRTILYVSNDFLFVTLVFYTCSMVTVLGILIWLIRDESKDYPLFKGFIDLLFNFHSKVAFLPTITIFIATIDQATNSEQVIELFFGSDVAVVILGAVFIGLNGLLALIPSLLNFQPVKNKFIFSHRPSALDFLDFFFKILCIILIKLSESWTEARYILYFLSLLLIGMRFYITLKSCPFHNLKGERVMMGIYSLDLAIAVTQIILIGCESQINFDPILIMCFSSPAIAQFFFLKTTPDVQLLISKKSDTTQGAYRKILYLEHLLQYSGYQNSSQEETSFKAEEVYFMGIVKKHSPNCHVNSCFCKFFTAENPYSTIKFSSQVEAHLKKFRFETIKSAYEEIFDSVEKTEDTWLTLDFIQLILNEQPDSFPVALCLINQLKMDKMSKLETYFVGIIVQKIKIPINFKINHSPEKLDANQFFEYKSAAREFRSSLIDTSEQVLFFWNLYKANSPLFIEFKSTSTQIHKEFSEIHKDWNILKANFGMLLIKEYKLYSSFLALVQNSPKLSRDLLFELNNFIINKQASLSSQDFITKDTIRDDKNVTISVNMSKNKLGQIFDISPNVKQWLDWEHNELIGLNLNNLIPSFLRESHSQFLLDHLATGHNKIILKNRMVLVQHRKGHVIPCFLYITPDPNISKGFRYVAIIRPIKRKTEYVVTNENYDVLAYTADVGKDLELNSAKNISELRTRLQENSKVFSHTEIYSHLELKEHNLSSEINVKSCKFIGKSGYRYTSKLDNELFDFKNVNVYNFEKSSNKVKKKSNQDAISSFSNIHEEKTIPSYGINLTLDKPSDLTINSKAIFIQPKENLDLSTYDLADIQIQTKSPTNQYKIQVEPGNNEDDDENDLERDYFSKEEATTESEDVQDVYKFYKEESNMASSLASRKSSNWREMHEVDLLIQEKPKASYLNSLLIFMVAYLFFVLCGTVASNTYASSLVTTNGEIANIMRDSTLRLYYFLEVHRRVRILNLIAGDYIPSNFRTNNLQYNLYNVTQINYISDLSIAFSDLNNEIGESIYILEKDLINKMYEPVLLVARRSSEPDLNVPLSGAVYEYIQMIVSIRKSARIRSTNTASQYILKNTLGDILIRSEQIPPILLSAVQKSDSDVNQIIVMLITVLSCGVAILLVAMVHNELKYIKGKSRYIYMIMRCDDKDIDTNIARLKDFVRSLGTKIEKGKYAQLSEQHIALMKKSQNDKKGKQSVKRVNTTNVNKDSAKLMAIGMLLFIGALGPMFALILVFLSYTSEINKLITNLMTNEEIISKYVLLNIEIYEYIGLNDTSIVRNLSISSQLNQDFDFLKGKFQFYNDLYTGNEANDERANQLVSGNLCDIFYDVIGNYSQCVNMAEGSATSGIFGITSYMTRVLNRVQIEYESSGKQASDIANTLKLSQLRDLESIFDLIFSIPFFEIDSILIDSINKRTSLFQTQSIWITVICFLTSLGFGILGWKIYYQGGIEERKNYRMILKFFPTKIIKSQGKIKNYLYSDIGNMFDS